jgi:hypothetical protein
MPATEGKLHIVYVYRNPADVMASYWRFLHTWDWAEGPLEDTALGFATAAPMGQSMRYQFRQYPSMLERWANNAEHWVDAARRANNIHIVRYEDLAEHFEDTIQRLGRRMGMKPARIAPPSRGENVVAGGALAWSPEQGADNRAAVDQLARAMFPALMDRLGYGPASSSLASAI